MSIAGSMSDSMEESGDGGMMMLLVACATFGRRRKMERRHSDVVDVTSGAILLRLLLSVFLT